MKKFIVSLVVFMAALCLHCNEITDLKVKVKKGQSWIIPRDITGNGSYGYFLDPDSYRMGGYFVTFERHDRIKDHMEEGYQGKVSKRDIFDFLLFRRKKNMGVLNLSFGFGFGALFSLWGASWLGFYGSSLQYIGTSDRPATVNNVNTSSAISWSLWGIALLGCGALELLIGILYSIYTGVMYKKMNLAEQKIIDALNGNLMGNDRIRIKFDLQFALM